MKSNHLLIIAVLLILGAWAIKVYAGTLTMNTYYPAPNGYYDTLTVRTKLIYPCYSSQGSGVPPINAMYKVDGSCTTGWPY